MVQLRGRVAVPEMIRQDMPIMGSVRGCIYLERNMNPQLRLRPDHPLGQALSPR